MKIEIKITLPTMIKTEELQSLPLFKNLSQSTRQVIARRAFWRKFPMGKNVIIEGNPAEFGYFILSGQARVLRMSQDGRLQIIGRFERGAPLNIISLLVGDQHNRASIEALTELECLVLRVEDFNYLIEHCHDFSNLLLQTFAHRMAGMVNLAASLSLYSVRARLAQFLMALAERPEAADGWTQDEIAAQIGTVRDVVGRSLRDFEAQGLIQRYRGQITLLNRPGLEAIAEDREK